MPLYAHLEVNMVVYRGFWSAPFCHQPDIVMRRLPGMVRLLSRPYKFAYRTTSPMVTRLTAAFLLACYITILIDHLQLYVHSGFAVIRGRYIQRSQSVPCILRSKGMNPYPYIFHIHTYNSEPSSIPSQSISWLSFADSNWNNWLSDIFKYMLIAFADFETVLALLSVFKIFKRSIFSAIVRRMRS
jgi:hypothetical protein